MSDYFKQYETKNEYAQFLEEAKEIEAKEWDLSEYDEYLADLYFFVGPYFHWSQDDFDNCSIDLVLYYRDRILENLQKNTDEDPKSLPIDYNHWSLILTMKKLFGGSKKR